MTTHRTGVWACIALALICVFGWNSAGIAQTRGEPEHFTASFVDLNTGRAGPVQMSVTRWTTETERTAFQQALFKKGQNELLETLRDGRSVGRIYTPGSIGYDLRYAESKALPDGGREIILATDRPMSFWEITNRPHLVASTRSRGCSSGSARTVQARESCSWRRASSVKKRTT